jgi:hypothetical protein
MASRRTASVDRGGPSGPAHHTVRARLARLHYRLAPLQGDFAPHTQATRTATVVTVAGSSAGIGMVTARPTVTVQMRPGCG